MYHVHLNIGSNLGDRLENIKRAVSSLRQLASVPSSVAVSDPFRSSPWGFVSSNEFINVGMSLDCVLDPEPLLQATQRIQRSISSASHRDASGAYIDRIIDIDIIAIDDLVISSESLVVPHLHIAERDFVLAPMAEIAPNWRHPLTGLTAAEMLENLH